MLQDNFNTLTLATEEDYNEVSGFRIFDIKIRRIISP